MVRVPVDGMAWNRFRTWMTAPATSRTASASATIAKTVRPHRRRSTPNVCGDSKASGVQSKKGEGGSQIGKGAGGARQATRQLEEGGTAGREAAPGALPVARTA